MNNYFSGVSTVEDIKRLYRKLAMENHPDRGGSTEAMQAVNAQYHVALESCHGQERTVDDKVWTYYYNAEKEQEMMDVIDATLAAKILTSAHHFEIIGKWLWITGDTRPIRAALKELGYRWHSKRTAWYWRPSGSRRSSYNKRVSLRELANFYGSSSIFVEDEERKAVTA